MLSAFRAKHEAGKVGGSGLKTDLGDMSGVVLAVVLQQAILDEAHLGGAIVVEAPLMVATECSPIGDIALGHVDANFIEGVDDMAIGAVVAEHTVDHVTVELWEARDLAQARPALARQVRGGGKLYWPGRDNTDGLAGRDQLVVGIASGLD